MRQLAILPDEAARQLADYLFTLKIETLLQPDEQGMGVWVCDEDRLPQARQELAAFQSNPSDGRYRQAAVEANQLRLQEEREEEGYRKQQEQAAERLAEAGTPGPRPVTWTVLAASVLVTFATQMGQPSIVLTQKLVISTRPAEWPWLSQVASGEVWRLVTPMFLHFDWMHILFNAIMFLSLAGQIESLRGSGRLLLVILVVAVVGNLTQYYVYRPSPGQAGIILFGGLSGVVYGLFGYVWVKSRLEPHLGLQIPTQTVVILLGWFFLCLFFSANIANGAHAGGLVAGLVLALISLRRQG